MKVYAVLIYNLSYSLVSSQYNLDEFSFIFRYQIRETIEEISRKMITYTQSGRDYKIEENFSTKEIIIYGSVADKYSIIITDPQYPSHVAYKLLNWLKETSIPDISKQLPGIFSKYQDPRQVDKLAVITSELDETKVLLYDAIEKIINRGENLAVLAEKAENLQAESFAFEKEAVKLNRCCHLF